MNRKHICLIGAMGVSILVMLAACQNPISLIDRRPVSGVSSGVITVKVQRVAPHISRLFSVRSSRLPALFAAARAYIAADKLHFTLLKDSALVTAWDELLAPPQEILTGMIDSDGEPQSFSASAHAVAAGSGYTLQVELYNSLADADSPVVGGTSLPFAVSTANTEANPVEVSITCIPLSPITLTKGVTSEPFELAYPWVASESGELVSVGSEQWYQVELDDTSDTHLFSVTPSEGSTAFLAFTVYDGGGKFVGVGGFDQEPGEPAEVVLSSPAGTYYIGVIDAEVEGGPLTNGPFTVLVKDWDSLLGSWTSDTWNGNSAAGAGIAENVLVEADHTWSAAAVWDGTPYVGGGTWVNNGSGSYTLDLADGNFPSGVPSMSMNLNEAEGTLTVFADSENTMVFVRGTVILPPTGLFADDQSGESPSIALSWDPSLSPEVTQYKIWRGTSSGNESLLVATTDSASQDYRDEDPALQMHVAYYYTVTAAADGDDSTVASNEVFIMPGDSGGVSIGIQ